MSTPTEQLAAEGVSIWLDDLSRERITSGNLAELIATRNVSGVTTNPTIFAGALSKRPQLRGAGRRARRRRRERRRGDLPDHDG